MDAGPAEDAGDGAGTKAGPRIARPRLPSLNRSPLARKIITFNLLALVVLVSGVLYMNSSRDHLVTQREQAHIVEAELIAAVFEAALPEGAPVDLAAGDGVDAARALDALRLPRGIEVWVADPSGAILARSDIRDAARIPGIAAPEMPPTYITDRLNDVWSWFEEVTGSGPPEAAPAPPEARVLALSRTVAGSGATVVHTVGVKGGEPAFWTGTPIERGGAVVGVLVTATVAGEIDQLVRAGREEVLQMFAIAILVSIGLSLVLASTIATPLSDLAEAAAIRQEGRRGQDPARVRIPDLTGRPDEIGNLSGALRGMVAALYDRIDSNEQFAADVAHEIKNPLASLRSAVGTLRVAKRDHQRARLLEVIEHDVRRLDRLVSDISNASRLDSELVKEEQEAFDLVRLVANLAEHLGEEAREKGIEFITDLPSEPIRIEGLEARLAQVFVNLVTNATSFCEEGDAIRVWCRRREDRVLVVVEDTGPGIPEVALSKIFNRFYSERPQGQFGNNSGLGLAISKQIVEAHGGVVWAENIRAPDADPGGRPLGARFVVGLPV
ncbi:sensor histidine kinase [Hasllibacter halocynthiae]|uniref:sensor histidine kinase n=1 Tax=Hasllibacter halocynthiae TaxID=595589 RepID=UPI001FE45977|nr:sensor histidine kinase [Hasllibacter halocynthiae]